MKVLNFLSLATTGLLFICSCKKEPENIVKATQENTEAHQGQSYAPDISSCLQNVSLMHGMLRFESRNDVKNTYECLADKSVLMDDAFLEEWGHLEEDALFDKMHEISYDEDYVYVLFNELLNHQSLRQKVKEAENIWLSDSLVDTNNIPEDMRHVVGDIFGQTVMDEDGAFMIMDTIFIILPNGDLYIIPSGDLDIKNDIANGDWNPEEDPSVTIYYANGRLRSSCKSSHASSSLWQGPTSAGHGMQYRCGFYTTMIWTQYYSWTKSYKWKKSKWKKNKVSSISAAWTATSRNQQCNAPVTASHTVNKSNKSEADASYNPCWGCIRKSKSGEVGSSHKTPYFTWKNISLTW